MTSALLLLSLGALIVALLWPRYLARKRLRNLSGFSSEEIPLPPGATVTRWRSFNVKPLPPVGDASELCEVLLTQFKKDASNDP